MTIKRRILAGALGVFLATAARGEAQVSASVACTPGISACTSLRFFIQAAGGVDINQLFVQLLNPAWQFVGGPVATMGTYSAMDSFGPFGGFTTLGSAGSMLAIDFTENGFPFSVADGDTGLFDVEASGESDVSNLWFDLQGTAADGSTFDVTSTPEPATVTLLATGLMGLAGLATTRRRRT